MEPDRCRNCRMEERLKALVARVRAIYPKISFIYANESCNDYSHVKGVSIKYELYVASEGGKIDRTPTHTRFPTIEELETYVTELEETHRKDNMTDVEKIRAFVANYLCVDGVGFNRYVDQTEALNFIDSLKKEGKRGANS